MFEVINVGSGKVVTTPKACNHVYVVDVSGSMYGALPTIKNHLKNSIGMVVKPEDTVSVIWFSGRGQTGVVFEGVNFNDALGLSQAHAAIDRYLNTVGLTCFTNPMALACEVAGRLPKDKANNFIMMTDGYDNSSSRGDIMVAAEKLPTSFESIAFVEYGYYADRDMLQAMAEKTGGLHIFSEGVNTYPKVIEGAFNTALRVNRIEVAVNKAAKHGIYVYGDSIHIVAVEDGKVSIPEDVTKVHSIVPKDVLSKRLSNEHLYMVMYYAAKTNNTDLVNSTIQELGEEELYSLYENAFTKQELSAFEEAVAERVFKVETRKVNRDKKINIQSGKTVMELLAVLVDWEAELMIDSPHWDYERVGVARVVEEGVLPRFVKGMNKTVSMRDMVFSSTRPNVSLGVTIQGFVELPVEGNPIIDQATGKPLKTVKSHIHRNFTIIRDGIKNVSTIPVIVPVSALIDCDCDYTVLDTDGDKVYVVLDISKSPVIRRADVKNYSDAGIVNGDFKDIYLNTVATLETNRAILKAIGHYLSDTNTNAAGLASLYGEDAAKWLSSIGVRDYGFSPLGTKSEKSGDEYPSIEVDYKIKSLSSLPSYNALEKKLATGKPLTISEQVFKNALDMYNGYDKDILAEELKTVRSDKRMLEEGLARMTAILILGRCWFSDDESFTAPITVMGVDSTVTVTKERKMISI